MIYLKLFNENAEYKAFKEGENYILPNVSYIKESNLVAYNPYKVQENRLICTYNVTDTTSATQICYDSSSFTSMEVDGVLQDSVTTEYTFDTVGEHTIKFELANPTTIGEYAFNRCESLTSIVIPYSVTSIGEYAFHSYGLASIVVSEGNTVYDSRENCNCLIETATNTLIKGCPSLTSINIPDSVTTIGKYAFSNCSLTSIVIPDSVTTIGEAAFYYCSGLTSVRIGSGVTTIGSYAFENCSGLTGELIIPDSVTTIGKYAFNGCYGLTGELVIPDSVTSIGEYAFYTCSGLTSVHIGSGITTIGDCVFRYCYGLTSVVIPDSVTSIGNSAFYYCSGLTSVHIGSGVTSIEVDAFNRCSRLTSITCNAIAAPTISGTTFQYIENDGILKVPTGSDYSSWMSTGDYYLGKYNWTIQYI